MLSRDGKSKEPRSIQAQICEREKKILEREKRSIQSAHQPLSSCIQIFQSFEGVQQRLLLFEYYALIIFIVLV